MEMVSLSSLSTVAPLTLCGLCLQWIIAMHPIRVQPAIVANAKAMATIPAMIVGVKLLGGDSDGGYSVGFHISG